MSLVELLEGGVGQGKITGCQALQPLLVEPLQRGVGQAGVLQDRDGLADQAAELPGGQVSQVPLAAWDRLDQGGQAGAGGGVEGGGEVVGVDALLDGGQRPGWFGCWHGADLVGSVAWSAEAARVA